MARRVLIIYRVDESIVSNKGVIKKLDGQAKAFVSNGWDADTIRISAGQILLNDDPIKKLSKSKFGSVLFEFFQSLGKEIDFRKYDMLYIRYGLSFVGFISFLKQAKENNNKLKILLEFATYPYTDEWTGAKGLIVKKVDSYYRQKLSKYVDHVIHLGEEKEILGMPCINSENGIDFSDIKVRSKNNASKSINLIAVGKWQFWHGLDRLILGIAEAEISLKQQIKLVIIGEGPALQELKGMVEILGLNEQIIFVGEREGDGLDSFYEAADVGIGTLGMHRKNIKIDSSLKHRAYAGRGLPFILCAKDRDFPRTLEYVKYYEESDVAINIESLVTFVIKVGKIDPVEIREYAMKNLSWHAKISRTLQQIDFD